MPEDLAPEDLEVAIAAAHKGGALAAEHFGTDFKSWKKDGGDPVTEIDLAVNAILEETLRGARPSYGWLSEETKDDQSRLSAQRVWVVDPIDGTRAFMKGRAEFCVSIACVEAGEVLTAVLYDPIAKATYTASKGGGAWLGESRLQVSETSDALTSRLVLEEDFARHRLWPQPWQPASCIRPNSMALRLAFVATGAHDLTLAVSAKQDWDIAAADLILREAGGRMTDQHGGALRYNKTSTRHPVLVGAAPGVHDFTCAQVRGLIQNYQAEQAAQQ
ncbi:MAG: 3'(2'),5'-bisphosphate nucleotidase CysQ [Pseudomonadota bacterium]